MILGGIQHIKQYIKTIIIEKSKNIFFKKPPKSKLNTMMEPLQNIISPLDLITHSVFEGLMEH